MKKAVVGRRIANDKEVMDAVNEFLGTQQKEFFSNGIKALQQR